MKKIVFLFLIGFCTFLNAQFSDYSYQEFITHQKELTFDDDISMSYIDEGKGDAILLVHGVPTSSWVYRKIIDSLVLKGKRVIIPDLIGYGQSDKPKNSEEYNYDKQAQRLMSLMSHLQVDSWTHVCMDMGSLVTWKMMDLDSTGAMNKLIVLNSILQENGFNPPMKFKKGFLGKQYARIYCSALGKSMVKTTLNNGMYKQKIDKKGLNGYVKPLKKAGNRALYSFFTSFKTIENITDGNEQRFNNFKGEIIFIWGIHDKILTLKQVDYFVKHINNEDLTIIHLGKSSHFVPEQELKNYLNKI